MESKYVDVNDVFVIAEIKGKVKARAIIAEANQLAKNRGYFIPHQFKAPRDLVLEVLGQKSSNEQGETNGKN